MSRSPARFDPEKLLWLNQQYIKEADPRRLAELTAVCLERDGRDVKSGPPLEAIVTLVRDRVSTVRELADAVVYFYRRIEPAASLREQHYAAPIRPAILDLKSRLETVAWNRQAISEAIEATLGAHNLKMPKLAMPLRVMVTGTAQTPAVDAVLELIGRDEVLARIAAELEHFPS